MAQSVEHVLGKDEVSGSSPDSSSISFKSKQKIQTAIKLEITMDELTDTDI